MDGMGAGGKSFLVGLFVAGVSFAGGRDGVRGD